MRKLLLSTIALLSAFVFTLAGCASFTILSFDGYFLASELEPIGYKEICEYKVNYTSNYESNYVKNPAIDDILTFDFTDGQGNGGTYVTELEIIDSSNLPSKIQSDIENEFTDNATVVYKYLTEFKMPVTYTIPYGDSSYNIDCVDVITTETYFASLRLSYAPIYSKTDCYYSLVATNSALAPIRGILNETEITYNKQNYTINYTAYDYDKYKNQGGEKEVIDAYVKTVEYDFRTVIDNNQLLFIARNIKTDINDDQVIDYKYIPTVSLQYKDAMELLVHNTQEKTYAHNLDYTLNSNNTVNGLQNIIVKHFEISLYNGNNVGSTQYVGIQKKTDGSAIPYSSLLCYYVKPLITYGNIACMGALEYKLDSVTVTK